MFALLNRFDFSYPDGDLFFDKSGLLSRRIRQIFPDLTAKSREFNQREFEVPSNGLQLLFGAAFSRIQSFASEDPNFGQNAAAFLDVVCETLELSSLNQFHFEQVLGFTCSSRHHAQDLMLPLIPEEQRIKMASLAPLTSWTSLQSTFTHGDFAVESKFSVLSLPAPLGTGDHLLKKMQRIIFPVVQFPGVSIEEAIEFLRLKSRDLDLDEADPARRGVSILLEQNSLSQGLQLSLDLHNVPMIDLLRYIVELAGLKFKMAPDCVVVTDSSDAGNLPHLTFHMSLTGQKTLVLADFDAAAFIQNSRDKFSSEILQKLAPHLAKL